MTHKIAIIKDRSVNVYDDYYGETTKLIAESITEWEEVSDEDFKTLQYAAGRYNYHIVEQPTDTNAFIARTISDYKKLAESEAKKMAEEKAKREKSALERKWKKELKTKEDKMKLLKKLQEELALEANNFRSG